MRCSHRPHEAIVAAIRSGDPDAARDAARSHIRRAGAELARTIADEEAAS